MDALVDELLLARGVARDDLERHRERVANRQPPRRDTPPHDFGTLAEDGLQR